MGCNLNRKGLIKEVIFEENPQRRKGASHVVIKGRVCQAGETAKLKALRWKQER